MNVVEAWTLTLCHTEIILTHDNDLFPWEHFHKALSLFKSLHWIRWWTHTYILLSRQNISLSSQTTREITIVSFRHMNQFLWHCLFSNPFGIKRVNEGAVVNSAAPAQPLIKAASNEGSLIDTTGLASPLTSINSDSHMMRLMTVSHAGRWQDIRMGPPPLPVAEQWTTTLVSHSETPPVSLSGCVVDV